MRMSKKRLTGLLALALVATVSVGTLAFFTDRLDASASAKAGTLKLSVSDLEASKTEKLKPSDGITVDYTITNNGNKSADIRETIVLTSSVAMTAGTEEFDLYEADHVTITNGVATIKTNPETQKPYEPLSVRSVSADGLKITYKPAEFVLDGTGLGAENEDEAESNAESFQYVLVFKNHAANKYQNVLLTLDYMAEAKQHRNTDNTTWATIATVEDFAFSAGIVTVVPEAN